MLRSDRTQPAEFPDKSQTSPSPFPALLVQRILNVTFSSWRKIGTYFALFVVQTRSNGTNVIPPPRAPLRPRPSRSQELQIFPNQYPPHVGGNAKVFLIRYSRAI